MNEKLFQFIWQFKLFDTNKIKVHDTQESLDILSVGLLNNHDGPDFKGGKIKLGSLTLVGDIELHIKSSDWLAHKHQHDAKYNKVIAHVVYVADKPILDSFGNAIPCLELKEAIDANLLDKYAQLTNNLYQIACGPQVKQVRELVWVQQWERALTERLIIKANRVQSLLAQTNNDWSEVFYISLARAFGGKANNEAMEALASRIPLKNLARQKENLVEIEALFFGVAGMLNNTETNDYTTLLKQNYKYLQIKYQLQEMDSTRWKFLKMRPANFPTVRIAQLAALVHKSNQLFSQLLEVAHDADKIKALFVVNASTYWDTHYSFKPATHKPMPKSTGDTFLNGLLINTVAPILYAYGVHIDNQEFCKHAMQLLLSLPAEENNITKIYTQLGVNCDSAGTSQAMIQQYEQYCTLKKCLNCSVGYSVLKA
jgi:hypothetical protein